MGGEPRPRLWPLPRPTPQQRSRGRRRPPSRLAERVSCCLFADMINKQDCKYGDNCTFAYHQEEIDVWTEERKGTLNRDLLFDPLGGVKRGSLTIAKLLKEHQGIFTFLCEVPARPSRPPATPRSPAQTGLGGAVECPGTCAFWRQDPRISRSLDRQKVRLRGPYRARTWILSSPLISWRWKLRPKRKNHTCFLHMAVLGQARPPPNTSSSS